MHHTASPEFNASPQNPIVKYDLTDEVERIGKMNFQGNVTVTPHTWYQNIKMDSGAVDFISIALMSEILYWYRPTYARDESTGALISVKKKFKADALQRSKASFAKQFGITERQVKDALSRLEKLGLIKRDYRTVQAGDLVLSNVLFIIIFTDKIEQITFQSVTPPNKNKGGDMTLERHTPPPSDVETSQGVTGKRRPHIYSTKSTTEQQQHAAAVVPSEQANESYKLLESLGFDKKACKSLCHISTEIITRQAEALKKRKQLDNPLGWLRSAIENNWTILEGNDNSVEAIEKKKKEIADQIVKMKKDCQKLYDNYQHLFSFGEDLKLKIGFTLGDTNITARSRKGEASISYTDKNCRKILENFIENELKDRE